MIVSQLVGRVVVLCVLIDATSIVLSADIGLLVAVSVSVSFIFPLIRASSRVQFSDGRGAGVGVFPELHVLLFSSKVFTDAMLGIIKSLGSLGSDDGPMRI